MADFTVRSDHIDVEQIMRQIRARIRDKRGADYTEAEIRELANVKLDKFLDPKAVRSDLLLHYRQQRRPAEEAPMPLYAFDPSVVYTSDRGTAGRMLAFIRKLLNPILKLFFNPNPLLHVVNLQTQINDRVNKALVTREEFDALNFEMFNNLVVELTRLGIEVRNLRMQVESFGTRLDFDERRARALEGAVQYKPGAPVARPSSAPTPASPSASASGSASAPGGAATATAGEDGTGDEEEGADGESGRARRRRRRRGRRRGQGLAGAPGEAPGSEEPGGPGEPRVGREGSEPRGGFMPRDTRGPAPESRETAPAPSDPGDAGQADAVGGTEAGPHAWAEPVEPEADEDTVTLRISPSEWKTPTPAEPTAAEALATTEAATEQAAPEPVAHEAPEPDAHAVEPTAPAVEPAPAEVPVIPAEEAPQAPQAPVRQFTRVYERDDVAPPAVSETPAPAAATPGEGAPAEEGGEGSPDRRPDDSESSRS